MDLSCLVSVFCVYQPSFFPTGCMEKVFKGVGFCKKPKSSKRLYVFIMLLWGFRLQSRKILGLIYQWTWSPEQAPNTATHKLIHQIFYLSPTVFHWQKVDIRRQSLTNQIGLVSEKYRWKKSKVVLMEHKLSSIFLMVFILIFCYKFYKCKMLLCKDQFRPLL